MKEKTIIVINLIFYENHNYLNGIFMAIQSWNSIKDRWYQYVAKNIMPFPNKPYRVILLGSHARQENQEISPSQQSSMIENGDPVHRSL